MGEIPAPLHYPVFMLLGYDVWLATDVSEEPAASISSLLEEQHLGHGSFAMNYYFILILFCKIIHE
jgi:hypothetical protein